MTKLNSAIEKIHEAFQEDYSVKIISDVENIRSGMDSRICLCGHNRNVHDNGEGGSPSKCEEDCLCMDYKYSLLRSLLYSIEQSEKESDSRVKSLLKILSYVGLDLELVQLLDNFYTVGYDVREEVT